ncbi:N-acetylmuramoyl-L-alanine amidase [Pollutimonas nitritireducens]|uniref:N-acetylmuramoyl-L-alanine amidase n=1 Tax=Pollutimonas nitritireducens TaxID=2045209 RepID=A0A2N4UFN3_9BURK|nr:N-acetylmuramoyl-L-alanine amidase [Pollutimonas nitritireducens]PLC53837.1 N-acetylmuramoyl-L-alanine amidase [Pollutimonas nitritireducens]
MHLKHLASAVALLLLTACSTYRPGELNIDRSIQAKSQNSRVEFIVLHYTATGNEASLKILSEQNVSSHYLITNHPEPLVYQLVDENRRAWHAGDSEWFGRTDMNSGSIGIEIVNHGPEGGNWEPYTKAQTIMVGALLRDIVRRHQIKPFNIVGHSDIAPQRKVDPGPLFPWKQLAEQGLGRWFDETRAREYEQEFLRSGLPDMSWMQAQLQRTGYAIPRIGLSGKAMKNVIAAFQMHYRPSRHDGIPDAETLAILKALP